MELSEILDSLSGSNETTKTASDDSQGSLSAAIDRALAVSQTEKTASYESNPGNDLIKIAQDISNAEQDALIKEAHLYGRAVADGFAARMSQYESSSSQPYSGQDTIKEAMELGYLHASNAISNAQNGYAEDGMDKTAEEVNFVKISAYEKGQEDAVKVASYIQGQEDAVKVASFIQGQEDAVKVAHEITKVAQDYENFGFKVGNSILSRL